MAREMRLPIWASGAIGGVALGFSAWQAFDVARFLSHAAFAQGVIVDEREHPTIRFALPDGRPVEFVQNGFVDRPNGSSIPVAYEAADPAGTAVADLFFPMWWTALWTLPGGVVFLGAALAGWRVPVHMRGF